MTDRAALAGLADLLARRDVYAVLTRYCRALDRADLPLMERVYWPDGVDVHGVYEGNAAAFARFIVAGIQDWFEVSTHCLMNVHMEVAGDVACSESYLFSYSRAHPQQTEAIFGAHYLRRIVGEAPDPGRHIFWMGGRYLDRLERRDGEWRIARRQVVMDWNDCRPTGELTEEGMFATLRPIGRRGPGDPVYASGFAAPSS